MDIYIEKLTEKQSEKRLEIIEEFLKGLKD